MLSINWSIAHSIRAFDVLASSTFTSLKVEMSSPREINPPISTTPSPLVTQFGLSSSSNALLSNE
jgi:hypothetical protein